MTYTTQSPLLSSIAYVLSHPTRYDSSKDGILSAEEMFHAARPIALAQTALLWTLYFTDSYLNFKYDAYRFLSLSPTTLSCYMLLDSALPIALFPALLMTTSFYLAVQLTVILHDHHLMLNWPTIHGNTPGQLPLIQT